jgi:hypothetical protein
MYPSDDSVFGGGCVGRRLLTGRPLMRIALYIDQLLTVRRVVSQVVATMARPQSKASKYPQLVRDILDGACADEAKAFATKYRDFNPDG